MEETPRKLDEMATADEQQAKQSVQDTQLLAMSPPHDMHIDRIAKTIIVKDVYDISALNINPLTI